MDKLGEMVKKAFILGLGAVTLTREKLETLLKELSSRGEDSEKQIKTMMEDITRKMEEGRKTLEKTVNTLVKKAVEKMNLATREDLKRLERKIRELEKKIT